MARVDYDHVAKDYDAARAMELEQLVYWRDAVAPYVGEDPSRCVVDVGAGTGLFALAFAHWFDVSVVAVEPSSAMRSEARARRAHTRIDYVDGDDSQLQVAPGTAGLAWLSTVLHHIPDLTSCARALRLALRPRGPVLVRSAFPGRLDAITLFRFFPEGRRIVETFPSVEETVAAFGAAGFSLESLTAIPQVSAPSLGVFAERVGLRADSVLRGISDHEFATGMERLESAVARGVDRGPVVDRLDLLVLR